MMKIHILLLRDTAPAMDLLSPQQSAALAPVSVPETVASNWYLLVRYLFKNAFSDKKLLRSSARDMPQCGSYPEDEKRTGAITPWELGIQAIYFFYSGFCLQHRLSKGTVTWPDRHSRKSQTVPIGTVWLR